MLSCTNRAATAKKVVAALLFLTISAISYSSTPNLPSQTPPPGAVQREAEAQRFVNQRLTVWQDRLDLKDWKLKVLLLRPKDLEPKTLGNIHWDTDTKEATIGVLSSYDYTMPWKEMLADMEFTIVHEMVHLHLASMPKSDASRRIEEHAVNELARALLNLAGQNPNLQNQ